VKKNRGRSDIGGVLQIVEDTSTVLNFFVDDWDPDVDIYGNKFACVKTTEMVADATTALKCDIYNNDTVYIWWGAYFQTPSAKRNSSLYTHFRCKIRAATGYGQIKVAVGTDSGSAELYSPNYSPDGLSIDDKMWRTIYVPLADLGITGGVNINGTSILNNGVKPLVFYVDSIAFIKASSTNVNPMTYPIIPVVDTSRTSGYFGFSDFQVVTSASSGGTQTGTGTQTGNGTVGTSHNGGILGALLSFGFLLVVLLI